VPLSSVYVGGVDIMGDIARRARGPATSTTTPGNGHNVIQFGAYFLLFPPPPLHPTFLLLLLRRALLGYFAKTGKKNQEKSFEIFALKAMSNWVASTQRQNVKRINGISQRKIFGRVRERKLKMIIGIN